MNSVSLVTYSVLRDCPRHQYLLVCEVVFFFLDTKSHYAGIKFRAFLLSVSLSAGVRGMYHQAQYLCLNEDYSAKNKGGGKKHRNKCKLKMFLFRCYG